MVDFRRFWLSILGSFRLITVEKKASPAEFSKYQLFTGELNKIIGLLLILTQRMHRYEMMLNDLDMSEEADRQQKVRNLEPFFFISRVSRRFSCH